MKSGAGTPPPRSYGKLAKRGLMWGFARESTRSLIILPTSMVIARLLSPEESGIAAAAYFVMQLAGRLTQFGLGVSLVRAKSITGEHVACVFTLNLLTGAAVSAAFFLAGPYAAGLLGSAEAAGILPTAGLGFLIGAFNSVPTALLSRDMRYRESTTTEWLSTLVSSAALVLLAWLGFSYWSIVYSTLLGDGVRGLARAWAARWVPRLGFSRTAAREMLTFGLGVYARNLLEYCSQNIDNLIVGRLLGMAALGYYDKAFTAMAKLTAKVNLAGPSVSFRAFALIHEDALRFRRAYRKVILSVTAVGYPIMAGLAVVAYELIEVLFGARWLPAALPFRVLSIAAMLKLLNTYASTATQATGNIWSEVRRQALSVLILVAAVAGLSSFGIVGAAVGVLLSTIVSTILLQLLVRQLTGLGLRDLLAPQIPGIACSVVLVAVLSAVRHSLYAFWPHVGALATLAVCAGVGLLVFMAFLLVAPFHEMRQLVEETVADLGLTRWLRRRNQPAIQGP